MAYNFVNPYNFVPLGENCNKNESDNSGQKYTGYIKYSVLTKTPLMIPDMSANLIEKVKVKTSDGKEKEVVHCHKVFMSLTKLEHNDKIKESVCDYYAKPESPFIPGSEIRGMFRSAYEILTDSCLSVLNTNADLSKRTHEVFKAGLIHKEQNGKYSLYKADDCIFRAESTGSVNNAGTADYQKNGERYDYIGYNKTKSYKIVSLTEGQKVKFDKKERERGAKSTAKNLNSGSDVGYVIKGLDGPNMGINKKQEKHNCHIFYKLEIKIKDKVDISGLEKVLKIYEENGENIYSEYSESLKEFKKKEISKDDTENYFPVYYSEINGVELFLSPAAITRELYSSKLGSKVKEFEPCLEKGRLCPACRLFGTVNGEKAVVASKIRFSDLLFDGETPEYYGKLTLAPLGEPKLNNMEFYLERPTADAVFWTYDYYINIKGEIKKNEKGINGRKFYWHSSKIMPSTEKTNLNSTVYPLAKDNKFTGYLYFNNITEKELNQLVFLLNCCENVDDIKAAKHGYKLGLGKPLGLGSVATKVTEIKVRNREVGSYSIKPYNITSESNLFGENNLEAFKKMTVFDAVENRNVDYPRMTAGGDIFEWYSTNHKAYKFDKKAGKYVDTKSPNARKQEYFDAYMEPLNPVLKKTDVLKKLTEGNSMGRASTENTAGKENPKPKPSFDQRQKKGNAKELTCTECGKTFTSSFTGPNPKCWNCRNK